MNVSVPFAAASTELSNLSDGDGFLIQTRDSFHLYVVATRNWRKADPSRVPGQVRVVSLTDTLVTTLPDRTFVVPCDVSVAASLTGRCDSRTGFRCAEAAADPEGNCHCGIDGYDYEPTPDPDDYGYTGGYRGPGAHFPGV